MISVKDVKSELNKTLSESTGVRVLSHVVDEGFDKPAFFTDINVIKSEAINKKLHRYNLRLRVLYYPENKNVSDMYTMASKLADVFKITFNVKDRKLNVNDFSFDIDEEEGYMYFTFTTEFNVRYDQEPVDIMKKIEINEREV